MSNEQDEVARFWRMIEADAAHRETVKAEMDALYARLNTEETHDGF